MKAYKAWDEKSLPSLGEWIDMTKNKCIKNMLMTLHLWGKVNRMFGNIEPKAAAMLLFSPRHSQSRACGAFRCFAAIFAHKQALCS